MAEILRLNVSIQCAPHFKSLPSRLHIKSSVTQRRKESYYKIIPTIAKLLLAFYLLIVESCYTYSSRVS